MDKYRYHKYRERGAWRRSVRPVRADTASTLKNTAEEYRIYISICVCVGGWVAGCVCGCGCGCVGGWVCLIYRYINT